MWFVSISLETCFSVFDIEEAIEYAFDKWSDVFSNRVTDLSDVIESVYSNVDAVVDMPHSYFFDHFLEKWPKAKVSCLTQRSNQSEFL